MCLYLTESQEIGHRVDIKETERQREPEVLVEEKRENSQTVMVLLPTEIEEFHQERGHDSLTSHFHQGTQLLGFIQLQAGTGRSIMVSTSYLKMVCSAKLHEQQFINVHGKIFGHILLTALH